FLYPLSCLGLQVAYRVAQVANILFAFVCGLAVRELSEGRIWWPVGSIFVMAFPGFWGSLCLGQNATLSLAILLCGWVLVGRGWAGIGGGVWGLLELKPVWAVAFLTVIAFARRWRMVMGMILAGVGVGLLTLPLVGWRCWLQWLEVGRAGSVLY